MVEQSPASLTSNTFILLGDYSQAVYVGAIKYVSMEAVRLLLRVFGRSTFGYGTRRASS